MKLLVVVGHVYWRLYYDVRAKNACIMVCVEGRGGMFEKWFHTSRVGPKHFQISRE